MCEYFLRVGSDVCVSTSYFLRVDSDVCVSTSLELSAWMFCLCYDVLMMFV